MPDVPGHIGRYRVELDWQSTPSLRQFFTFQWALIANLGVDLLVIPLEPIFGLELAVKLIVLTIPPLTVLGVFFIAREIHGRVPPTALFAVPFVYGHPFNFGFINFALSMALAFLALGWWLRLGRQRRVRLRAALFIPISCFIWLVHAFGWGALGLMAFSTELVRQHDAIRNWPRSILRAGYHMVPLALPLALTLFWRSSEAGGPTDQYFNIAGKIFYLAASLRDRWLLWDCLSVAPAIVLIGAAMFDSRLQFSRRLAIPAAVLAVIYFLLPGRMFGSWYADMRLGPFMIMLAVLAIRFRDGGSHTARQRLALLGLAFIVLRFAGNAVSFEMADRKSQAQLEALDHVPMGAKVLSLAKYDCGEWPLLRHAHLGSFVITRKLGFSNDQWQLTGANLLIVHYPAAGRFTSDQSSHIYSNSCIAKASEKKEEDSKTPTEKEWPEMPEWEVGRPIDQALGEFPRDAFDYVWLLEPPDFDMGPRTGLTPIWRGPDSILYRVDRPASPKSNSEAHPPLARVKSR